MAGELQAHFATGAALYAVLLNENAQPWNGTTFDATPTTAEWASYVVALTEWSTTGLYRATMPAGIVTPGTYQVLVYKRLGGVGTEAPTDPVVWSGELAWSGSAVVGLEDVPSAAAVADAVWDEALSGHTAAGSAGKALADAGGGGVDYDAMIAALAAAGYTVVDTDSVSTTVVSKRRGDLWTVGFTDLGALGTWTKLWLTIKSGHSDADASATVQILLTNPSADTDGLQRLNGAAATPAQGGLVVDDSASGDITATIAAVATAQLAPGLYYFDVQILRAAGTTTLAEGTWTVRPDATRATS